MSATLRSERVDRREALSLLGWAAALGLAASGTFLFGTQAPAQTIGMERRQESAEPATSGVRNGARAGLNAARKGVQGARSAVKSGATRTPT